MVSCTFARQIGQQSQLQYCTARQSRVADRVELSVADVGCSQVSSRQTEWGGAEMMVCRDAVPLDRERSRELPAILPDRMADSLVGFVIPPDIIERS